MRITEAQLRRIIREEIEGDAPVTDVDELNKLALDKTPVTWEWTGRGRDAVDRAFASVGRLTGRLQRDVSLGVVFVPTRGIGTDIPAAVKDTLSKFGIELGGGLPVLDAPEVAIRVARAWSSSSFATPTRRRGMPGGSYDA